MSILGETIKEQKTGAHLLLKGLLEQNVELIFGYPGGAVLPLYDALYDADIPNILTRHEQGAVHAAQGYAKATGKPGVVVVTSGPGATNAVTGIADANSDSVPLVVFTGQVTTDGIGKDAFQEADILGITVPITKTSYQVRDVNELPKIIQEAFHIAVTGRPGPVVIDLPKDMTVCEGTLCPTPKLHIPSYQPNTTPSILQVQRLLKVLGDSRKPVLLIGGGVISAKAEQEARAFAERYQIPVVSTLLGLGVMPTNHPLFLGMGGMHGSYSANLALMECDLLISLGARFDDRLATSPADFAKEAIIAHVDIDPAEIGKIIQTDIPIVADVKECLEKLLELETQQPDTAQWLALCQERKADKPFTYDRNNQDEIKPQKVVEIVGELTKGEAIVVTDVGQHQMWAAQFYPFQFAKQLITSGGLGTMGYGIPAAIGAKFGHPDKEVVVFVGDGGFQMTNQELAILNENGLDIKFVLLNNSSLGMVRQWQEAFFNERRSKSVFSSQPDFIKMAEAYGIAGVRITDPQQLEEQLTAAFKIKGPVLIEVVTSTTEHVLPMVPPGQANDRMIGVE